MSFPEVNGVNLVGSIPLGSTEDAFRTVFHSLPGRVKRVPDGETGRRGSFARWQFERFKGDPRLVHLLHNVYLDDSTSRSTNETEIIDALDTLSNFSTEYDDYALRSYQIFKQLRSEQVIPAGVRFQVSLPSPTTFIALTIKNVVIPRAEPLYEAAIIRSLQRIQENIPADDLAIQWDVVMEFMMLEGIHTNREIAPWFEALLDGTAERLARYGASVKHGVELGYHFCYGDVGHKHFKDPQDTGEMVSVANAMLQKCPRSGSWIHLPVPKARTDTAYFAALQHLKLGSTELILGLVHHDDLYGTRARIDAAGKVVRAFSVATECGLGRTPVEQLSNIFDISSTVSIQEATHG